MSLRNVQTMFGEDSFKKLLRSLLTMKAYDLERKRAHLKKKTRASLILPREIDPFLDRVDAQRGIASFSSLLSKLVPIAR